jgi:hypothetical protein
MTTLINIIAENCKCSTDEAADCLSIAFSKLHPDAFVSVSDGLEKQINEVRLEAMLCDAGISDNKARKPFSHMKLFFGDSLFVSKKHQHRCFGNIYLLSIVDKMTWADKTIVHYWW